MRKTKLLSLILGSVAVALPMWAQADVDDQRPERGVARMSLINGDVNVRRGDTGEWSSAALNAPVLTGDQVSTGNRSRAEIQFDSANMLRIASDANLTMGSLENNRFVVQLSRGLVTFRVLRDTDADSGISTEQAELRPTARGEYRVEVMPDGSVEMTVNSGRAEVYTPRGVEQLRAGRTLVIRGSATHPIVSQIARRGDDDWDRWNDRRDKDLERSESYRYVSRDVYGAEDLDGHGSWVELAPYGRVWTPRVSVGWAPYRSGRWAWVDWYGWTWVSYDTWGWAPYHYGRWMYEARYGWCWWPGGVSSRHYWSPALVSFVGWGGGGGGISVGIGFGRVGWIPLAPFETYRPWYGRNYYRNGHSNVTIINNVNITNVYRNARINNGVTVVDGNEFARGTVNHRGIGNGDLMRASTMHGQVPVTPSRESLRMSDRAINARVAEPGGRGGGFYSRTPVRSVDRVPFDEQRRGIEEMTRRTFPQDNAPAGGRGTMADGNGRRTDTGRPLGRSADPVGNPSANGGWRRLGDTPSNENSGGRGFRSVPDEPATAPQQGTDGGWRRFGTPGASGGRTDAPAGSPPIVRREENSNTSGWRRFGTPGDSGNTPNQTPSPRGERSAPIVPERSSRSRDTVPSEPQEPRGERSAPIVPDRAPRQRTFDPPVQRNEAPRNEAPRPVFRNERPSPPIVRQERQAPEPRPDFGGRAERQAPSPRQESGGRVERQAPPAPANSGDGGRSAEKRGGARNR